MVDMLKSRPSSLLGTPNRSPIGTPTRSPAPWFSTPTRSPIGQSARSSAVPWFEDYQIGIVVPSSQSRTLTGFSTPQRITVMGRELDLVDFRTPQNPVKGTNNWGGASPMLSVNVPREALESSSYLRFNRLMDDDDDDDDDFARAMHMPAPLDRKDVVEKKEEKKQKKKSSIFSKLGWKKEEKNVLGSGEKKKKKRGWIFGGGKLRPKWSQVW